MKYIRNISDEQNKAGDTDNVFRLNLFEDDKLFDFGANNLTVNIANSSGYILSLTPKKETENTVIDLDFNDAPLKSLTPDDYLLEVEVKFSDGTTATFPTKGGMPFTVNSNLKETSGTLVPTVTFDNVLDAVDEKIAVYMDTVKVGPQGPVGPAGNVDTSHDNTFTGANKFTQLIDGALKTRPATFTDFNAVASAMKTYAGFWFVGTQNVVNGPTKDITWGAIEVVAGNTDTNGFIKYTRFLTGETYITSINGSITGWYKISNDAAVVHNTGTETVAGDKTFTSTINGNAATATKWQTARTLALSGDVTGSATIDGSNNVSIATTGNNLVHKTSAETINGDKTFLSGNYGLRVTTTGIQKTSDNGATWSNI